MNQITTEPSRQDDLSLKARLAVLGGTWVLVAVVAATLMAVSPLFGQNGPAIVDGRFHDDLLDCLVGKWVASGIVHGNAATLEIEAEWVLQHQYLRIHEKGGMNVPGLPFPFEGLVFVGCNPSARHYVAHELTVWGGDDPAEGFLSVSRTGNEIKLVGKQGAEAVRVQRFTWDSASRAWHIESRQISAGKEGEPFLDLKATAAQ